MWRLGSRFIEQGRHRPVSSLCHCGVTPVTPAASTGKRSREPSPTSHGISATCTVANKTGRPIHDIDFRWPLLRQCLALRYIQDMERFNERYEIEIMTESLFAEDRVSIQALANELGLDRATLIRWADQGYQRVHLESYRLGKKRFTSHQAAQRFLAAVNSGKRDRLEYNAAVMLPDVLTL
jgi:hypothetical protein